MRMTETMFFFCSEDRGVLLQQSFVNALVTPNQLTRVRTSACLWSSWNFLRTQKHGINALRISKFLKNLHKSLTYIQEPEEGPGRNKHIPDNNYVVIPQFHYYYYYHCTHVQVKQYLSIFRSSIEGTPQDFFSFMDQSQYWRVVILENYGGNCICFQGIQFYGADSRVSKLLEEHHLSSYTDKIIQKVYG